MPWNSIIGPAVIAAVVSGIIAIVGMFVSNRTARALHSEKLKFDERLAERRFEFDKDLAKQKFNLEVQLTTQQHRQTLAEEVLSGFYEVQNLMRAVRSPAGYQGEAKNRVRSPGETDGQARRKDTYFAILERFDARREVIAGLMSRQYRMVAWFGQDSLKPFDRLHGAFVAVTVSARMLVDCVEDGADIERETRRKWEADIWLGVGNPDPIETEIGLAIGEMEKICKPILSGH